MSRRRFAGYKVVEMRKNKMRDTILEYRCRRLLLIDVYYVHLFCTLIYFPCGANKLNCTLLSGTFSIVK